MGITGCNVNGYMDDQNFSKPMPWIGIYIAAASLACLLAVAADLAHGVRGRKLWFPCKYFRLNATSLSIIAVAVKLSVDLNTPVPHRHDQLAKLSSSALICTIMGNSVPSLGVTDNRETMMNVVAMGILVITMIVNICIQFVTGVIYVFWAEHAVIMFLMLVLLMTMFSSALAIPKMKHHLELKYKINEAALKERDCIYGENGEAKSANQVINNLRDELMRVWMMAHTSSPQFVLGRSVTCTASGAFCLLSTVTLAEAMLRSYLMPWCFSFCTGESDYKWSTMLVLIIQVAAVTVGTIAPAFRWLLVVNYSSCPSVRRKATKRRFRIEGYWTDKLVLMKERPICRIRNRKYRKLAHDVKLVCFKFLIQMQIGIVLMCKATQFVSVSLMCLVFACCDYCKKLKSVFNLGVSNICCSGSESRLDLRRFVLHLDGEEELIEVMMKDNRDATNHWFEVAETKQPKHLIELIDTCSIFQGFKGLVSFDSDQILPLHAVEAPYSWSLPLVTLASIIVSLPNIERCSVRKLMSTLNDGILYVKFIEKNLDREGKLIKLRMASEIVWLGVDLYDKWLDLDLYKLSLQCKSPKEALERLSEAAKIRYHEFKAKYHHICMKVEPSLWPPKLLASNSMYRISKTTLLNHESIVKDPTSSERLFEALKAIISDMLGACLTNLPQVLSSRCLNSAIEERENCVRHAVHMLGQTKKIIEMLHKGAFPCLDFSRGTNIEDWRLMHKQNSSLPYVPFSLENDSETTTPKPSDLCLNID